MAVEEGFIDNPEVVANPLDYETASGDAAGNARGWVFAHPSLPQSLVPIRGNPVLLQVMVSKEPVAMKISTNTPS